MAIGPIKLIVLGFTHPDFRGEVIAELEKLRKTDSIRLLLIEHHWAVPLRDAVARARGFRISDGFISPFDLITIGLVNAEEARQLHDLETAGSTS